MSASSIVARVSWLYRTLLLPGIVGGSLALAHSATAQPASAFQGPYLGLHLGGAFSNTEWLDHVAGPLGSHTASGPMGGAQAGYNFTAGRLVYGIDARFSYSGAKGKHLDGVFQFGPSPEHDQSQLHWIATVTGRAGMTFNNDTLVYGRAGLAVVHQTYSLTGFFAPGVTFASTDSTRPGWLIGGGVEHKFNPQWSLFGEYNYMNFGDRGEQLRCAPAFPSCGPPGATAVGVNITNQIHSVMVGINYHFNWP